MLKKFINWLKGLFGCKKCECTCTNVSEQHSEVEKPKEDPQPKPDVDVTTPQEPTEPVQKPKITGDPRAPKPIAEDKEVNFDVQTPSAQVNKKKVVKGNPKAEKQKPVKKEVNTEKVEKAEEKPVIAPKQFYRNTDLVTYTIKNETEIGDAAFYGCINLEQLIIKTKKVPRLGKEAIHTRVNRKLVVIPKLQILVPEKMIEKYKNNKVWGKYADKIKPIVK